MEKKNKGIAQATKQTKAGERAILDEVRGCGFKEVLCAQDNIKAMAERWARIVGAAVKFSFGLGVKSRVKLELRQSLLRPCRQARACLKPELET